MRILLPVVALLCLQASADTKILIEKANKRYIVIPDCYVPPDAEVTINKLRKGAPVRLSGTNKKVRCEIQDFYQIKS